MKPFKELSPLNSDQLSTIKQYLDSRDIGENDWIRFGITTKKNSLDIPIDWSKPSAVLLTNVSWDAQLHYESRLFENMHDWILQTIRWFIANPDCNH
jgi:protein gp37